MKYITKLMIIVIALVVSFNLGRNKYEDPKGSMAEVPSLNIDLPEAGAPESDDDDGRNFFSRFFFEEEPEPEEKNWFVKTFTKEPEPEKNWFQRTFMKEEEPKNWFERTFSKEEEPKSWFEKTFSKEEEEPQGWFSFAKSNKA